MVEKKYEPQTFITVELPTLHAMESLPLNFSSVDDRYIVPYLNHYYFGTSTAYSKTQSSSQKKEPYVMFDY